MNYLRIPLTPLVVSRGLGWVITRENLKHFDFDFPSGTPWTGFRGSRGCRRPRPVRGGR